MMALAPLEIQAGMAFLTSISDIWIRRLRRPMVSTVHQQNMNMVQEAICHHPRLCYKLTSGITPTFACIRSGP